MYEHDSSPMLSLRSSVVTSAASTGPGPVLLAHVRNPSTRAA